MAVGAAAAKGIKELTAELAKLQQMLLKAKNAKKDTKPIEQLIAKKRGEISKQKECWASTGQSGEDVQERASQCQKEHG